MNFGHTILSASADPSEDMSQDEVQELALSAVVEFDQKAVNNVTMCSIARARCIMMLQSHRASWLFSDRVASRQRQSRFSPPHFEDSPGIGTEWSLHLVDHCVTAFGPTRRRGRSR